MTYGEVQATTVCPVLILDSRFWGKHISGGKFDAFSIFFVFWVFFWGGGFGILAGDHNKSTTYLSSVFQLSKCVVGLTKEFYQFRLSLLGYFGPVFLDCRSTRILIRAILSMYAIWQVCGLGLDVSVSRRSRNLSKISSRSRLGHVGKRLGLGS